MENILNVGKSTVHREMQKMKFSYITPRPVHYKQDKEKQEEFKKNLNEIAGMRQEKKVFFFDESRFGTQSKLVGSKRDLCNVPYLFF